MSDINHDDAPKPVQRTARGLKLLDSNIVPSKNLFSAKFYTEDIIDQLNNPNTYIENESSQSVKPGQPTREKRSTAAKRNCIEINEEEEEDNDDDVVVVSSCPGKAKKKPKLSRKTQNLFKKMKKMEDEHAAYVKSCQIEIVSDNDDDNICLDDSLSNSPDGNIDVKVQVYNKILRFPMKMGDKFGKEVFRKLSQELNVEANQIVLCNGDEQIFPDNSPLDLKLTVANLLFCFVDRGTGEEVLVPKNVADDKNFISLKFQASNRKMKQVIAVHKCENLSVPMQKFAESYGLPLSSLVFKFDGEKVDCDSTPVDLDIEDGDCIDVVVILPN